MLVIGELDSWCFEPSQPQKITSGLKKMLVYHQVLIQILISQWCTVFDVDFVPAVVMVVAA